MIFPKDRTSRRFLWPALFSISISVAVGSLAVSSVRADQQTKSVHARPTPPKFSSELVKKPVMPFHLGESLAYRVSWTTFSDAASVALSVPEVRDLFGWQTWHFRAAIHTVNSVRVLFAIDDEFDSYTDTTTLESHQYEMYLNELGRERRDVLHFLNPGQRPRAPGTGVIVPPGTRDPVGAFFSLRGVNWNQTPELRVPIYDGHDLYEMSAKRESESETVTVAGKNVSASRIAIRLFQNGKENPGLHFVIWLANDAARTPVIIQALLPFGNVRAELTAPAQ